MLPRIGINADHDSRYARVLFKIGGLRGQGTLYEKFEEVLSRMGIEIEFDPEDGGEQSSQRDDSQYSLEIATADESPPRDENEDPRHRQRRNSESSAWDAGKILRSQSRRRRNSSSSIAKVKHQADSHQNALQETRSPQQQAPLRTANLQNQKADGPEHNVGTWLKSRPDRPIRGRNRSISTHGSMRIRRRSPSGARRRTHHSSTTPLIPASGDLHTPSELTAITSGFGDDKTSDLAIPPRRYLSDQDADGLMQIKASLLLQQNLSSTVKHHLQRWRDRALQLRKENIHLESVAQRHDKKALLQSALDSWRLLSLQKRQAAETERFFAHIERRAARARDLYLMHVAFTHWSTYASEQVQRTALARRHIVRTRIFNAWRDITAVNELKVRRQVLKKFFSLWRHCHALASADAQSAVQKYAGDLVKKIYQQWIRNLWAIKAVSSWAEGTKRRTLFRWIVVSHQNWEAHRNAEEERRFQLIRRALRTWRIRIEAQVQQIKEADQYRRHHICLASLRKWCHDTRMVPAKNTVQIDVSSRLLRKVFETWLHRTRQERAAVMIDHKKILQEALTNWQYKSRTSLVQYNIETDTKLTTIYKWTVAKRCTAKRRKKDETVLKESFQAWIQKMRPVKEKMCQQTALAQSLVLHRTHDIVFRHWCSRMEAQRRLEAAATSFRTPRVLRSIVFQWLRQSQHLRQMETWSQDAKFFFLATKTVRRWRASTEASKRERRKAAYAQVRRTVKINLARGILRAWLEKAKHVGYLTARARETSHNRNIIIGMNIFDRWRAHTEDLAKLEPLWRGNVAKKQFALWRDRSNALREYNSEAILTYKERRQGRTIKKWSLLSLQLRYQTNYAAEICEKNAKRTFRKIFTYWHQKAAQQRPKRKVEILQTDVVAGPLGSTARAEAWSDFGDDLQIDEWARGVDEAAVSSSIPGYLSTPSKRTERVMAVAAKFSTTPKALLSTPFERHLRAQWSGSLLPPIRKDRGKSTLSMGGGFEDIDESNTNHDLEKGQ